MVYAGLEQERSWYKQVLIGGSGPWQTAGSVVSIDGSGANASVTADNIYAVTNLSGAAVRVTNAVASTALSGVTVSCTTVVPSTSVSGGDLITPLSFISTAGSPYLEGVILKAFAAETIISGGMWIVGSAANAGLPKLRAAPASTQQPLGYCVATVASGATTEVLTRGLAYFVAEGNIAPGVGVKMGAGAALNCVAATADGSGTRGLALVAAGSEQQCLVMLY